MAVNSFARGNNIQLVGELFSSHNKSPSFFLVPFPGEYLCGFFWWPKSPLLQLKQTALVASRSFYEFPPYSWPPD
ncbi:hypothetical protein O6P43_020057 [Quillaja saponaria]|uniref:Uncharacterized protein n=1 Tax=Quillaja saponaria TaxID=32244 RepID=A0AAD7PKW8_QUISA|nr:hypothetical protein O6P43_020057 [Quillaja saponaria]